MDYQNYLLQHGFEKKEAGKFQRILSSGRTLIIKIIINEENALATISWFYRGQHEQLNQFELPSDQLKAYVEDFEKS